MFHDQDRSQLRRVFFETWSKVVEKQPLTPLEAQIAAVIESHGEYHGMLQDPERHLDDDYVPEGGQTNPFLHMAMHLAIREQVATDRPTGINGVWHSLLRDFPSHDAEHKMMECLGQVLWDAQRSGRAPDEQAYLECVKKMAGG